MDHSIRLIRGDKETSDAFWKRHEKKLNELTKQGIDYHKVNVQTNYVDINYKT